jgi:hypothetical protein
VRGDDQQDGYGAQAIQSGDVTVFVQRRQDKSPLRSW